jgi:hypothetical protein
VDAAKKRAGRGFRRTLAPPIKMEVALKAAMETLSVYGNLAPQ